MKNTINFNKLFVSSESTNKCFFTEFKKNLNIISGRNTSGKSTLIQSLLFTFGVNDVKESLSEILDYKPTFRLDFTINKNNEDEEFIIIRECNSIHIKEPNGKVLSFHGINADNSVEHSSLKDYIREIVGFNLILEQKGSLKTAPLESMFLPYYISQSVGWVYLRESFSNLQFYKGFKEDYLDYYLGVNNNFDRVKYRELLRQRDLLKTEINNLIKFSQKEDFQFSTLLDETFGEQAESYIDDYVITSSELESERNKYIKLCNELSLLQNHYKILRRTKNNIKKQQFNDVDRCPACTQILSYSLEGLYSHYQKYNDTVELESHISDSLVKKKSTINSSKKRIESIRDKINDNYNALLEKNIDGVTFDTWIQNKSNINLYRKIQSEISELESKLEEIEFNIRSIGTEQDTLFSRSKKEKLFRQIFTDYTSQLNLSPLKDSRYLDLYRIDSFPRQGVELHKTVMAYHFALNSLIKTSNSAHRLPFLLDAILKEDIDETNLDIIFKFISSNLPKDTQSFISISEHKIDSSLGESNQKPIEKLRINDIKNNYFDENSEIIYIGEGKYERGFFSQPLEQFKDLHMETICIITP